MRLAGLVGVVGSGRAGTTAGAGGTRTLGLLLGFLADRAFGDPARGHPVAGFGRIAAALEHRAYADSRTRGLLHATVLVGGAVALGAVTQRCSTRPAARLLGTAAATWVVLGGRSLEREAELIRGHLGAGDTAAARTRLTHLVGRDTRDLGVPEICRAVVESVAENTTDAVVAPLLWGALAGVPGLLGHRAANTLDAMIGHRDARYERFGCTAARLDDLANWPAARMAALLTLAAAPARAADARRAWRGQAGNHPSPNAGVIEAAFAGALGVRLGGTNAYGDTVQDRGLLGSGRAPEPADITRAVRLARRVDAGSLAVLLAALSIRTQRSAR